MMAGNTHGVDLLRFGVKDSWRMCPSLSFNSIPRRPSCAVIKRGANTGPSGPIPNSFAVLPVQHATPTRIAMYLRYPDGNLISFI